MFKNILDALQSTRSNFRNFDFSAIDVNDIKDRWRRIQQPTRDRSRNEAVRNFPRLTPVKSPIPKEKMIQQPSVVENAFTQAVEAFKKFTSQFTKPKLVTPVPNILPKVSSQPQKPTSLKTQPWKEIEAIARKNNALTQSSRYINLVNQRLEYLRKLGLL